MADATDLMEVDLPGGVRVRLSKEEAAKVIGGRDEMKASLRSRDEELGRIKAEKEAAENKAARTSDEKAAMEAAKKGEIDAARDLLTREAREREAKLGNKLKRESVRALLASQKDFLPAALEDASVLLERQVSYDLDSGFLVVLDEAGQPLKDKAAKPVTADAIMGEWLKSRPHFRRDGTPSGTGASGEGRAAADAQAIPRSQYEAWVKGTRPDLHSVISTGKYRLVDG